MSSTREGNVYTWECVSVHRGVPTLDGGVPNLDGGGIPTLDVAEAPTLDGRVPTLARGYLPWIGDTYFG